MAATSAGLALSEGRLVLEDGKRLLEAFDLGRRPTFMAYLASNNSHIYPFQISAHVLKKVRGIRRSS